MRVLSLAINVIIIIIIIILQECHVQTSDTDQDDGCSVLSREQYALSDKSHFINEDEVRGEAK